MWKNETIGDVLSVIQNGVNCTQDKSGKGLKITRIETIADANINYNKTGFSNLDENQKQKAALKRGDILFSHINSPIHVGKTAIYDGSEPLYHGINLLRLNTIEAVDSNYFNFFLQSLFWSGYWRRTAKQSVNQASVNQTDIKKIPFSYPPLAEQQRIVAKLDAAFAEINTAIEAANAKETEIEKLGRFALETYFKENFRTKKIGDLGGVKSGGTPKSTEQSYWNGEIEWYSSGELNDMYASPTVKRITNEGLNSSNAKIFPKGTLLVGIYDTAAMKMSILQNEATFNQAIVGIPPNEYAFPQYLFYALNYLKPKILLERRGVRQQNLSLAKIKNVDVPIPSKEQQQCIVNQANTLTQKIEFIRQTLADKKTHLANLKASILAQELQSEAA